MVAGARPGASRPSINASGDRVTAAAAVKRREARGSIDKPLTSIGLCAAYLPFAGA